MILKFIIQIILLLIISSMQYISLYHATNDVHISDFGGMNNDFKDPSVWLIFVTSLLMYYFYRLQLHKSLLQWLMRSIRKQLYIKLIILVPLMISAFFCVWFLPLTSIARYLILKTDNSGKITDLVNKNMVNKHEHDLSNDKLRIFYKSDVCLSTDEHKENVLAFPLLNNVDELEIKEDSIETIRQIKSKLDSIIYDNNESDVTVFDLDIVHSPQNDGPAPVSDSNPNSNQDFTYTPILFLKQCKIAYFWLRSVLKLIFTKIVKCILIIYSLIISVLIVFLMTYYGIKSLHHHYWNLMETNKF